MLYGGFDGGGLRIGYGVVVGNQTSVVVADKDRVVAFAELRAAVGVVPSIAPIGPIVLYGQGGIGRVDNAHLTVAFAGTA